MDTGSDARQTPETTPAKGARLRSIAMIVIFDVGGPLLAYKLLRSAGLTTVTALVLSGVFPALGVAISAVRHHRLDVVGALVLAGILVGTVLGLISHNARLVLVEGSVPTAIFGAGCLGSLWARRPLIYIFALELIGPDTAKGQEMTLYWHHPGFRRSFRVITAVWGAGFLLEAALLVVIVYNTSTGTALAISKFMPYLFIAILVAWTVAYGRYQRKKTEPMAADGEVTEASQAQPSPEITQAADQT